MDYTESRRIIRQAISDNKLVVFVGAGASIQSGLPLWSEAVEAIYCKLGKTSVRKDEYLKIPQLYFNARGEKEYNELVKSIFKYDNKYPNEIHELIVQLNPCNVITTNYDDFLERSFFENGEFLEVIECDNDIPYVKNSRMIIKMHGRFSHNNFVFKEDDYLNYSSNFQLIETYIKALIAKNVVFFIGYSYNDPDIKQIFNWTKNILGSDFQRAYLLDVENVYDSNNTSYYQNLGINILYASECPCILEFLKNNRYQNTIDFLKYIVEDEKGLDIIDILYEQLSSLNGLNYIMEKYIMGVLRKYSMSYEKGDIIIYDSKLVDFFKQLATDEIKHEKLKVLAQIFIKSNIANIYIKESFKKNLICTLLDKKYDEYFMYFDKQNLLMISNYANSTNLYDDKLYSQDALKVAFSFYETREFTKCYYILKKISSIFKKEQNYTWYFITEFNRYHIGRLINGNKHKNTQIEAECQKIDLDNILIKNSLKEKKPNNFLKELLDFKVVYTTLIDVFRKYEKVEKDTHTNFIGMHNTTTIEELEMKVYDFYNYLKLNLLMIDIYSEIKEIFINFINAVFCAHSKKEKNYTEGIFGNGRNVVLKELSSFMIIIICKYLDKKSINLLIKKNHVKEIKLKEEAEETLFEILENYATAFINKIMKHSDISRVIGIFTLISIVKLSKERFSQALSVVNKLIINEYFSIDDYNVISRFIVLQYNNNRQHVDESTLFATIKILSERIIVKNFDYNLDYLIILLKNSCHIVHTLNSSLLLEANVIENMIKNSQYLLLVPIYLIANNAMQERIKETIVTYLTEDDDFNVKLYRDSIIEEIITPSTELEDKMLLQLKEIVNLNSAVIVSPDPEEQTLDCCIDLYLNNKLLDTNKFSIYFENCEEKIKFLYDMNNFEYEKFQLSWIELFNDNLKARISENQVACNKIKAIYKEVFLYEEYDENMLNDYFKYFDK